jgi:hypothetical protein
VRSKDIERSKDALISHYASLVPQALSELSSEEKNRIYKMMHLQILAQRDGTLIADWACNVLLNLNGVPHLQHLPSGSVPCLPVMVAKK